MDSYLKGRHVVVTGAGTGIGRAIAERLGREGAKLTLLARDRERLEETKSALPGEAMVLACDIRDEARVTQAFDEAAAHNGPIYGLVANSGIGGPNEPGPDDRFHDLVATNLIGSYSCARAAQRHLESGDEARHLIFMSSILARIGVGGYTGYCASKAALLGLARSLAVELAPDNVQVNAICPGWVNTAMAREGLEGMASSIGCSFDEARGKALEQVPLARMSEPEDVAGLVYWLLSPDARGVTGQGIDMNGGAFMS